MYIVHTFFASKPTVTCSICRLSQGYHYLAVHTHTHLPDYFSPSPLVSSHSSPVSTNLSMKTMSVAVSWSDALSEWIKTVCRVDQPSQTLLDTRPAIPVSYRARVLTYKTCIYCITCTCISTFCDHECSIQVHVYVGYTSTTGV